MRNQELDLFDAGEQLEEASWHQAAFDARLLFRHKCTETCRQACLIYRHTPEQIHLENLSYTSTCSTCSCSMFMMPLFSLAKIARLFSKFLFLLGSLVCWTIELHSTQNPTMALTMHGYSQILLAVNSKH